MSPFHSLYSTVLRWLRWTLSRLYLCTSSIINCKTEIPHITHWKYSSNFGFHMTQTLQWRLFMLQLSHFRLQYHFFSFFHSLNKVMILMALIWTFLMQTGENCIIIYSNLFIQNWWIYRAHVHLWIPILDNICESRFFAQSSPQLTKLKVTNCETCGTLPTFGQIHKVSIIELV